MPTAIHVGALVLEHVRLSERIARKNE